MRRRRCVIGAQIDGQHVVAAVVEVRGHGRADAGTCSDDDDPALVRLHAHRFPSRPVITTVSMTVPRSTMPQRVLPLPIPQAVSDRGVAHGSAAGRHDRQPAGTDVGDPRTAAGGVHRRRTTGCGAAAQPHRPDAGSGSRQRRRLRRRDDRGLRHPAARRIAVHRDHGHDLGDRTHQSPCAAMDEARQADAPGPSARPAGRSAAVTARGRRDHRPVELPAEPGGAARRGGVRRRQPGDDQDVGGDAPHRGPDGGRRARVLRRRRTRGDHRWRRRRRGFRGTAVRPPVLHRVSGRRGAGATGGRSRIWCR